MATEFTVIDPSTRIFRCHLSEVSADLEKNYNLEGLYFKGNLDNFRTFYSGPSETTDPYNPSWEEFELPFTYETKMSHLMTVKMFTLTFMGVDPHTKQKDAFVGEASVDLMTLATGPTKVSLAVTDGDVHVGRVWFTFVMLEVAEMSVMIDYLQFNNVPGKYADVMKEKVYLKVAHRSDKDLERVTQVPPVCNKEDRWMTFKDVPHHTFGCSVEEMMENEGFDVSLFLQELCNDTLLMTAKLNFTELLTLDDASASHLDVERSPSQVEFEPSIVAEDVAGSKSKEVQFLLPVYDFDGSKLDECTIQGQVRFFNAPIYVQMYKGLTVDGVVTDGQPYPGEHPEPPFVEGEIAAARLV